MDLEGPGRKRERQRQRQRMAPGKPPWPGTSFSGLQDPFLGSPSHGAGAVLAVGRLVRGVQQMRPQAVSSIWAHFRNGGEE